jgi:methionyl-tRNA formyltransferase
MTRIVFMGTPDFAVPSLAALLHEGYDILGVFTREDRPAGRGQHVQESPVKRLARTEGLAIYQPHTLRAQESRGTLAALSPDLIVVAAYGLILPQIVLDLPRFGCLNVHGSLLPRHRGAAPIAAALLAGDAETGVSIMFMDAGVDTGPVLGAASLTVAPDDTTGSLSSKLADLGAALLVQTLPRWLQGEIVARPQPEDGASYAPRIEKDDGQINWSEPAKLIERRVRAYQPWPTAYTMWRGRRLQVLSSRAEEVETIEDPGTVLGVERSTAGVMTGKGVLWLCEVQLAGKRALPIDAFLRGTPNFIGSHLGSVL